MSKKAGFASRFRVLLGGRRESEALASKPAAAAAPVAPTLVVSAREHAGEVATAAPAEPAFESAVPHFALAKTSAGDNGAAPHAATATKPGAALSRLLSELAEGATFVRALAEGDSPASASAQAPVEYAWVSDSDGPRLRLIRAPGRPASAGAFPGSFGVRLPDEIEKAASGNRITVRVLARSATSQGTKLACGYSTNEVGNSGWRWLNCGPTWEIQSFDYDVPPMKRGWGDFVGFMPGGGELPPAEVAAFSIVIA